MRRDRSTAWLPLRDEIVVDIFAEQPPAHALSNDIDCQAWEFDNVPF